MALGDGLRALAQRGGSDAGRFDADVGEREYRFGNLAVVEPTAHCPMRRVIGRRCADTRVADVTVCVHGAPDGRHVDLSRLVSNRAHGIRPAVRTAE